MVHKDFSASFAPPTSIMSIWNKGLSLAGGLRACTLDAALKGTLVTAPSGSGKSAAVCVSSLFTLARGRSSIVVLDVSGELHELTSGYMAKRGYTVQVLDTEHPSDQINPILSCKNRTDGDALMQIIVNNKNDGSSDPYWRDMAMDMGSVFLAFIIEYLPKELQTLSTLVDIADQFAAEPQLVDRLFASVGDSILYLRYKALIAIPEKTLGSITSTLRSSLRVFAMPATRVLTARNTIDFSAYKQKPHILYIKIPVMQMDLFAPLSVMIFENLFGTLMAKRHTKGERYCFAIIDELSSLRFSNIGLIYANCRKAGVGVVGLTQSETMLEMTLSKATSNAVTTNAFNRIFLPGTDLPTARNLEIALGKATRVREDGSEYNGPLLSAAEVRMLNEVLIIQGKNKPVLAKLRPYYSHFLNSSRCKIPPTQHVPADSFIVPKLLFHA